MSVSPRKRERFLRGFARTGLAAHGIVYCLMSLISVMAAFGLKKEAAGKSETFRLIHEQPFGKGVIFLIGVAMLGYVTLKFFQAFRDTRHQGKDLKAIMIRIGMFWAGLVYLALSITAFSIALHRPEGEGGEGEKRELLVTKALDLPWGTWVVGIAGVILFGAGIYQAGRGVTRSFMKYVDLHSSGFRKTFERIGIIGHISRGVVFCILGYLIVRAAVNANPGEAESTEGAFDFVRNNFGNALMGVVAAGLLAFGIFMLVRARHERMNFDQKR